MKCRVYDQIVRIEKVKSTATKDAHGRVDKSSDSNWETHESGYAAVQSKGGREFWKVQQVTADVSHVWWMPYSTLAASATPDMRLKHEGNTYSIVSVIDIDLAHDEVEIQTKREV